MNLVSNGIKFTHEGYISIRVELVEKNEENACIKFSVTDTGIGISDEQKKLLFQAFTRVMHPLPENMGHRSWAGYLQKAGGAYEGGNKCRKRSRQRFYLQFFPEIENSKLQ